MEKLIGELLNECIEAENVFISIEKYGKKAKVNIKGDKRGLLVALVSLEKFILDKLNISEEEYLVVKSVIGYK